MKPGLPLSTVEENVALRTEPEPNSGCWLWRGAVNHAGYGMMYVGEYRMRLAHRAIYLASGRTIPAGTELDHLCRVRLCVNPDHLEPVTHVENVQRASRRKVLCIRGHALDGKQRHGSRRRPHRSIARLATETVSA